MARASKAFHGSRSSEQLRSLACLALGELGGGVLLLDAELRILCASPQAEEVFGAPFPLGERAPQVLCGQKDERPMAEAMARGEAGESSLAAPDGAVWAIRSQPLRNGAEVVGHIVLFQQVHGGDIQAAELGILTRNEGTVRMLAQVERVAQASSAVLIRGETGTGKELVARAIHARSPRRDGPFLAINCAALPPHLLESELFGHVRGAFTGAVRDTLGYFRRASGGTLFLDEVAELPLELQGKLLRVLQERVVVPVGGTDPVPVDVRTVSATHRSLRQAVQEGRFRADLMYRIRVLPLFLPPLRARQEDIGLLAEHFVRRLNAASQSRQVERLSPGAIRALERYSWPGNVRELENAVEYAFVLGEGSTITEAELPPDVRAQEPRSTLGGLSVELDPGLPAEARRLLVALGRAGGSRDRAAQSLGMSRTTLWRKLRGYGLTELG
jgi:transcriptional regulator with PAS, ATPase and Fis domain